MILTLNAELGRLELLWLLVDQWRLPRRGVDARPRRQRDPAIVMPELHRLLAQGYDPLDALAALQSTTRGSRRPPFSCSAWLSGHHT
ncbi:MAG: hypothetical protein R2710_26675 [Acidimicrobiales bacterium]